MRNFNIRCSTPVHTTHTYIVTPALERVSVLICFGSRRTKHDCTAPNGTEAVVRVAAWANDWRIFRNDFEQNYIINLFPYSKTMCNLHAEPTKMHWFSCISAKYNLFFRPLKYLAEMCTMGEWAVAGSCADTWICPRKPPSPQQVYIRDGCCTRHTVQNDLPKHTAHPKPCSFNQICNNSRYYRPVLTLNGNRALRVCFQC